MYYLNYIEMIEIKNKILKSLKKEPNNYNINLKLGMIYINQVNYNQAKLIFKKLISLDKNRYEGYLNLSNLLSLEQEFEKAENILKKYLKYNDYNKNIISALATHYYNLNNFEKLENVIKKYIHTEENYFLFFSNAILLERDREVEKEIFFLEKSINCNKNFWPAYEKLFYALERTNKLEKLYSLITISKKIFKNNYKLKYYEALYLFRRNKVDEAIEIINTNKIENEFIKSNQSTYLINLYDLLSRINLKINKNKFSLDFAIKRNSISIKLEQNKKYNKDILLNLIKEYKLFYKSFKFKENLNNEAGLFHDNLTFLVGFPRSGTTLLDSILRSHSKTYLIEELPYLINLRHNFFKNNSLEELSTMSLEKKIMLQKEYFNSFNYSKEKFIIDKFPLNLIELGFIKILFPKSKIILALRHPLDTILSCVLTSFKINEAMANFENLNTAAHFYNEVFDLYKVYENSFKANIYKIKYENVVQKFDIEIENLLNYLNLEFENSVKNYHITAKNRERIFTPSYNQVIKPLYKNSINRYLKFSETDKIKHLINRWIAEFGY